MSDTIELLEAIGSDASLRHATAEELTGVLQQAKASEALTAAVATGDRSLLAAELGENINVTPQATQTPSHEEGETEPDDQAPDAEKSPSKDSTK